MTKTLLRNKAVVMLIIISVLLFNNGFLGIKNVNAQENHSLEEIIENVVFISFHKEIEGAKGNVLGIGFYIPTEYYYPDYKYGAAIFPEKFMERFDMYDDFLGRKERDGISVMDLQGNGGMSNGYRITIYNVVGFPEEALNQRITYVFYVKDTEDNIVYMKPYTASINSTDVVIDDFSDWDNLLQRRLNELSMNEQFEKITDSVVEFVDSIFVYLIISVAAVVVVWGAYIGIRVIVAKRKEEQINAKGMVKGLVIGIVVMAVLAIGCPLLIKGLAAWLG